MMYHCNSEPKIYIIHEFDIVNGLPHQPNFFWPSDCSTTEISALFCYVLFHQKNVCQFTGNAQ